MRVDETAVLLDTNILVRSIEPASDHHAVVAEALARLIARGTDLLTAAQCFVEFRAVATRPIDRNGLGLSPEQTDVEFARFRAAYSLVPDSEDAFLEWERLMVRHPVIGMQVFDARLVAAMRVNGIRNLLTLNGRHFRRDEGITIVEPAEVLA